MVIQHVRQVAVSCQISKGAFSDELVFEIETTGGETHIGAASRQYFWDENGRTLGADEPGDTPINGLVAARRLKSNNGSTLVAVPDGEVISVRSDAIGSRPAESESSHVPIESRPALGN